MHIHFLIKYLVWGVNGANYFNIYIPYRFSRDVAFGTFYLGASSAVGFVAGYIASRCVLKHRGVNLKENIVNDKYVYKSVLYVNLFLMFQIIFGVIIISIGGLNYSALFDLKMSMSFLFELRMVALLLICFILLNKPPNEWLKDKKLRLPGIFLVIYFMIAVLLQSRSVLFECAVIILFPWLMWHGNKIKIKYIFILLCATIVPNLIALPRFSGDLNWKEIIDGVFSFEYSVSLNNIVSAAFENNRPPLLVDIFISIPLLLIPSPIRNLFGLNIPPGTGGEYYSTILEDSGVLGGGFSMLAEAYINYSWWAIILFVLTGFIIGKLIKGASGVGRVNMLYATAPLIYASFIINLRNNFATFTKYSIQIVIIAIIMNYVIQIRSVFNPEAKYMEDKCISS